MENADSGLMAAIAGAGIAGVIVILLLTVVIVAGWWKIFAKAGKPGWAVIVPIYSYMVLAEVGGKPSWWGIVMAVFPPVGIFMLLIAIHGISKGFGKGVGYTLGLIFLPLIFVPMLGFGSATYVGHGGGDA